MPVRKQRVEDTLALTSEVEVNWVRRFYVYSTLDTLDQGITENFLVKTLESTLELTSSVLQPAIIENLADTLELTHSVSYISAIPLEVEDFIYLNQTLSTNIHYREVENYISLEQEVRGVVPTYLSISQNISDCWWTDEEVSTLTWDQLQELCDDRGLRQSVEVRRSITNLEVTSYLQLEQTAVKSIALQAGNHIHLQQSANTVALYETIVSELTLSQSVSVYKTTLAESELELEQTAEVNAIFNRGLTSTLNLVQYAVPHTEDVYTASPVFTPNVLPNSGQVILTWPFLSPIYTITLRAPEFDNSEEFEFQRINRRTRGGDLIIHRQDYWPIAERLTMTFKNLTHTVGDSLLDFLGVSLGREIGLLDHEGRQWKGLITTPSSRVSADTGRECQYSVSISFEGTIVSDDQFEASFLGTGLLTGALT